MKKIVRDSFLLQLPKNALQYLIGFSFYLTIFGELNILKLIVGLASFLLTYSSIYYYNDIMDLKEDKRNKVKRIYKALARGDISFDKAVSRMQIMIFLGLALGALISGWYTLLLLGLLVTNFLHSNPHTKKKFKKNPKYLIPNMFVMQFLKFSSGWFTFTTNINQLPFWIIACLCLSYIFGYIIYKEDIKNINKAIKRKKKIVVVLSVTVLGTFFLSLLIYPFKIPLLIIIPTSFLFFAMRKEKNHIKRIFGFSKIIFVVISVLIFSILLLNVPVVNEINEDAGKVLSIDKVNNISLSVLIKINDTIYNYTIKDLKELDVLLNLSKGSIRIKNSTFKE